MDLWRCIFLFLSLSVVSPLSLAQDISPAKDAFSTANKIADTLTVNGKVFSFHDLLKMPAWESDLRTVWGVSGNFRGVLFSDLLDAAGVKEFSRLSLIANNDYKVSLKSNHLDIDKAIVSYAIDGKELDPLDKGPFWLVWPSQMEALLSGKEPGDMWIWGLINIRKVN